jgi:hypothetical protein
VLIEPVKNPAPGEAVEMLLFQGSEVNLEFAQQEAGEQLFVDTLSSDDGIVEIIDEGSNSRGKAVLPGGHLDGTTHGRLTIEKKLKVADGCGTIEVKMM